MKKLALTIRFLFMFIFFIILFFLGSGALYADMSEYKDFVDGKLSGAELEKEISNFSRDYVTQRKNKKSLYPLYKSYVDKIGTRNISSYLESESASCHGVAHDLGQIIGERVEELNIGMGICASTCTYACLHGVFKVYFSKLGKEYGQHEMHGQKGGEGHDSPMMQETKKQSFAFSAQELDKFGKDVNDACNESNTIVEGFYKGNCSHGVGHAMGRLAQDTMLANEYCRVFSGPQMQYYCETGVFMEFGFKLKREIFKGKLKRSEKLKIALKYCGKNSSYPSACLRFLLPGNKSLGQISRFSYICSRQESPLLRTHCYNAMGYLSRSYIAKNPNEFPYTCSFSNAVDQKACISGVGLMKRGQKYREKIRLACKKLEHESEREFCSQQLTEYYYRLDASYFPEFLKSQ